MNELQKMANNAVALGEDIAEGVELQRGPVTIEERMIYLEHSVKQHTLSLDSLYTLIKELQNSKEHVEYAEKIDEEIEVNKPDNKIPVGTRLKGMTKGIPFWCIVKDDGFYVGITRYGSLSAAAQGVSGVRRSGWTFWRFDNGKNEGKSVKDIYK